jgi:hypothetical protein
MDRAPPAAYMCPITLDVMEVPVMAPDERSYEKSAIEQWLATNRTSPYSGAEMPPGRLLTNYTLRDAIEAWRAEQPMPIEPHRLTLTEPEDLIGQGSFGKVVSGTLQTHGREVRVAVKMLPDLTRQEEREQFDRELKAHITAMQGASGVCRLLGTCSINHRCFFACRAAPSIHFLQPSSQCVTARSRPIHLTPGSCS